MRAGWVRRLADGLVPARPAPERPDVPWGAKPFVQPVFIAVLATLVTLGVGLIAYIFVKDKFPGQFGSMWYHWDVRHYAYIAEHGYVDDPSHIWTLVFFPLMPFLMRIFRPLSGGYASAGATVSFIAFCFTTVWIYRLAFMDYGEQVARRTLVYLCVFPTAYFLHSAYSDGLYLMLAVGAFYYARNGKWLAAGALGALASATRLTAFGLLPALLLEYLIQKNFRWREVKADLLYLGLVPAGFGVYLAINYWVTGDPLGFLDLQQAKFVRGMDWPWIGALQAVRVSHLGGASRLLINGILEATFGLGALLVTLWVALRMRASYAIYMGITWLSIACNDYWQSTPRYVLAMFPGFIALALILEEKAIDHFWRWAFVGLQAMLLSMFVRGGWAY